MKNGGGTLTFEGTAMPATEIRIDAGRLDVNSAATLQAPLVTVRGGSLGGNGTVTATNVDVSGTIAPGAPGIPTDPGALATLTVDGAVAFNAGSTFEAGLLQSAGFPLN